MAKTETLTEKKNAFSAMLDKAINDSPLQQNQIAAQIGYEANPNIMTMFKRGMTRLPLDRVVPLAKALDADASAWLRMWFDAYMPGCISDIEQHLGDALTTHERSWINGLRRMFGNKTPAFKAAYVSVPVRAG